MSRSTSMTLSTFVRALPPAVRVPANPGAWSRPRGSDVDLEGVAPRLRRCLVTEESPVSPISSVSTVKGRRNSDQFGLNVEAVRNRFGRKKIIFVSLRRLFRSRIEDNFYDPTEANLNTTLTPYCEPLYRIVFIPFEVVLRLF